MSIHEEWLHYGEKNEYMGYVARLSGAKEPMPAVIVLQEIWGVDEHIKDVTKRLAGAGYVAFAPDLFALNGQRPPQLGAEAIEAAKNFLNTLPPSAWRNAEDREAHLNRLPAEKRTHISKTLAALLGGLNPAGFVEPIVRAAVFLREQYSYSQGQGIASVGFCLGGGLSAVLASHDPMLKGAAIFYGSAPNAEQIQSIACPVLGFYGELDSRLTEGVPALAKAMEDAGKSFEYYIFPQAQHAFFNDTRPSYENTAARASYSRLLRFLQETLS